MRELPYDLLEETLSYCEGSVLTNVALANTSLCNIARHHLYHYLYISYYHGRMATDASLSKLLASAAHLLERTCHLYIHWVDHRAARTQALTRLLKALVLHDQLRTLTLRPVPNLDSSQIAMLGDTLKITTLERLCVYFTHPQIEVFGLALSSPFLRDVDLNGANLLGPSDRNMINQLCSLPRPPLDTIAILHDERWSPTNWRESRGVFNISQVRRVHVNLSIMGNRTNSLATTSIPQFLEDLPRETVEEFIITIVVGRVMREDEIKKEATSLQSLHRFNSLQAISIEMTGGHPPDFLLEFADIILSYISPENVVRILIKLRPDMYASYTGLDNHYCFANIHTKFPRATLTVHLSQVNKKYSIPWEISGVDNLVLLDNDSTHCVRSPWLTNRQITDQWKEGRKELHGMVQHLNAGEVATRYSSNT